MNSTQYIDHSRGPIARNFAALLLGALTQQSSIKNIKKVADSYNVKYRYTIKRLDGRTVKIVTEKDFFYRKECVLIEKGYSYNLRLADDKSCRAPQPNSQQQKQQLAEARECSQVNACF
jgi:hypothetical protein